MSVYSTLTLTEMECIEKIAERMGIELEWDGFRRREKKLTKLDLLDMILFELTSKNPYSPNYLNNYFIIPDGKSKDLKNTKG